MPGVKETLGIAQQAEKMRQKECLLEKLSTVLGKGLEGAHLVFNGAVKSVTYISVKARAVSISGMHIYSQNTRKETSILLG